MDEEDLGGGNHSHHHDEHSSTIFTYMSQVFVLFSTAIFTIVHLVFLTSCIARALFLKDNLFAVLPPGEDWWVGTDPLLGSITLILTVTAVLGNLTAIYYISTVSF